MIRLGFRGRRAEMPLLARERLVEIGEQLVKSIDRAQTKIAAQPLLQLNDMRMQRTAAMAPVDALAEREVARIARASFS